MNELSKLIFALLVTLAPLIACGKAEAAVQQVDKSASEVDKIKPAVPDNKKNTSPTQPLPEKKRPISEFKTLEWTDLMPKADLDALLNPPTYINEVQDGSFEDQISSQLQNTIAAANNDRYQQALVSTDVVPEMNGQAIRIPGFIVPLEFDDNQTITKFFLVPFFGACIHVPPPPPNQIILVNYPQGMKLNALYDPFWISGLLKTSLTENEMATSAYSMEMQRFEPYSE